MSSDLRDLGRTVELRPARRGRRLVAVVAAVIVVAAVVARSSDDGDPAIGQLRIAPDAAAPAVDAEAAPAAQDAAALELAEAIRLAPMGRVGPLELHVPAEEVVLVSYHEASLPEALPIAPLGDLTANENATRQLDHETHPDGIPFHVQVSRGRANGSTSAVDVVLAPDVPVRAPISGTVTEVRPYQLYGAHEDVRIEIRPDTAPDHAVVLIHVDGVAVSAGDRVQVGDLLAERARVFPFAAVVDRQTAPDRFGHVHVEVKRPS